MSLKKPTSETLLRDSWANHSHGIRGKELKGDLPVHSCLAFGRDSWRSYIAAPKSGDSGVYTSRFVS